MTFCFSEPTIDDLLGDTLTQGLMEADGVDTAALKTMLLGLAAVIGQRPAVQHDRYIPAGAWARNAIVVRDVPAAVISNDINNAQMCRGDAAMGRDN